MTYKQFTLLIISLFLFLYILSFGSLFIVDPLQVFHKPWIRESYFIKKLRFQAAGIINNSEFDSIILGASMAANFSPAEASRIWNTKFVNLSPDGSLLSERSVILDYALRKKYIKNVIITLDGFGEIGKYNSRFPLDDYSYLYNSNPIDDIKIYLNRKYMKYLLCSNVIIPRNTTCTGTSTLETLTEWASNEYHYKRFGGLDKWFEARNNGQIKAALKRIVQKTRIVESGNINRLTTEEYEKKQKNNQLVFEQHVLSFVKKFPNTNFHLLFPPYSRIKYALWKQADPDKFELYTKKVQFIVDQVEKYNNANVFGFDGLNFPDDIANYKDPFHHHPRFNSKILKWMKHGDYRLQNSNVERYLEKISELAKAYDVVSIGKKTADYLMD